MQLTWLGQGGFLFEAQSVRLVVDPYWSDCVERIEGLTRLIAPPFPLDALRPAMVISTHDHLDHFDPVAIPQIAQLNLSCRFAGPDSVVAHALTLGLEPGRLTAMRCGEAFDLTPFKITGTPAYHGKAQALGLMIECEDLLIYVSGDTEYRPTLAGEILALAPRPIDLVLICINGRLGNMNVTEAADVACRIRPRCVVPMHYGLFAENTADPAPFLEACAREGLAARTLESAQAVNP